MNQYEAMFVFDPTFGSAYEKCESEVRRLVERASGEILLCHKWDERRLAYRIKGRKRGVYVLVYFKAPPEKIAPMERDAKLSEHILRLLVLRADGYTLEQMERAAAPRSEETGKPSGADAKRDAAPARSRESAREGGAAAAPVAAKAAVAESSEDRNAAPK